MLNSAYAVFALRRRRNVCSRKICLLYILKEDACASVHAHPIPADFIMFGRQEHFPQYKGKNILYFYSENSIRWKHEKLCEC